METFDVIGDIRERFNLFDDPIDKYAYLIELGKKSNGLSDSEKIDRNKIHGCASDSWLIIEQILIKRTALGQTQRLSSLEAY